MAGNSESAHRVRGRRAGREDRRGPRRPAAAARRRRHRSTRRRRRHALALGRPARARPRARRGRAGRARRRRPPRRPVHVHLHVGHDRPAEGLRPLPRQLPRVLDMVASELGIARGERRRLPVPPARPRRRAADPAAGGRPRLDDRLLRRRPEADRPRAVRGPADLPAVGAADLREDLHAGHGARRPGADQGRRRSASRSVQLAGRRPAGAGRAAAALRRRRRGAVQERARRRSAAACAGRHRRGADRQGDPRVLLRLRRPGARGLRDDRDRRRSATAQTRERFRFGTVGYAIPASRSRSPRTARSCSRARTSSRATTRSTTSRSARSRTAGCTRATSARSTRTASSRSPAARRTSSSPRAART